MHFVPLDIAPDELCDMAEISPSFTLWGEETDVTFVRYDERLERLQINLPDFLEEMLAKIDVKSKDELVAFAERETNIKLPEAKVKVLGFDFGNMVEECVCSIYIEFVPRESDNVYVGIRLLGEILFPVVNGMGGCKELTA